MTPRLVRSVFVLLMALVSLVSACSNPSASDDTVEIRVQNASSFSFDSVIVVFPEQRESYGAVVAGASSSFRTVRTAYRYAYVEVHVQGIRVVQQPIDYVGESLLDPGRYSYVIEVTSLQNPFGLSTRLQKE